MSTRRSRKAQREKEVVEDVQEKDIVVHDNNDDEADEEEPQPASQARSSNQKKKRVGVLDESGLTDADRRRVRQQQRSLLVDLEERGLELEEARNRNNELYESVRYTREAVLDGENMIAIANLASQKVDRLIQVPRYDADKLVNKLVERIRTAARNSGRSAAHFDWEILGEAAGACFNSIPSGVCFLEGPLMHGRPPVVRTRNVQRRRVLQEDKDAVEQRPEDVKTHTERDDNKLSAIEQSMKDMSKVLVEKVNQRYNDNKRRLQEVYKEDIPAPVMKKLKKYGVEIDAFPFLLNPTSFTQSVENIFHYSFLVKKGAAAINVRHQGLDLDGVTAMPGMVLKYVKESKQPPPAKQGIMALTMQDWRDLCQTYNISQGDLPTRRINKQAYKESLSQASSSTS